MLSKATILVKIRMTDLCPLAKVQVIFKEKLR